MKPLISLITLGISNLKRSRRFYEALGWKASRHSQGDVVFFKSKGSCLALYPSRLLAKDAHQKAKGSGFRKQALSQNTRSKGEVAKWLTLAKKAGGRIVKPAQDVFWGGHAGYFSDPDGHLWEVAWNPFFKMDKNGGLKI